QKVGPRGVEEVVVCKIEVVKQRQRGAWPLQLAHGDGPIQRDDRSGRDRKELVVQSEDLAPVGRLDRRRISVDGANRGLDLVRAGTVPPKAGADDLLALLDHRSVPPGAVLIPQ